MPYRTSDQRVAEAVRWLEPRIAKIARMFRERPKRRPRGARLIVPARIIRLYFPYNHGGPIVSDSIRALMKKYRMQAEFPPPKDGRRHSLVFEFRFTDLNKEKDE